MYFSYLHYFRFICMRTVIFCCHSTVLSSNYWFTNVVNEGDLRHIHFQSIILSCGPCGQSLLIIRHFIIDIIAFIVKSSFFVTFRSCSSSLALVYLVNSLRLSPGYGARSQ